MFCFKPYRILDVGTFVHFGAYIAVPQHIVNFAILFWLVQKKSYVNYLDEVSPLNKKSAPAALITDHDLGPIWEEACRTHVCAAMYNTSNINVYVILLFL